MVNLRAVDTHWKVAGLRFSDVGGPSMVGSDASEKLFKFWPSTLAKITLSKKWFKRFINYWNPENYLFLLYMSLTIMKKYAKG